MKLLYESFEMPQNTSIELLPQDHQVLKKYPLPQLPVEVYVSSTVKRAPPDVYDKCMEVQAICYLTNPSQNTEWPKVTVA
jgi:hypothetical protein